MVRKSWIRNLAALIVALVGFAPISAQTIIWTKVTASATQEFRGTVVSVSGVIPGQSVQVRDVRFKWEYNSAAASNACTAVNLNSVGGIIASYGSTPTGPKIGSVVLRCTLVLQGDGRYRGHMSFGVAGDAVYFYADANYTFTVALSNNKNVDTTFEVFQNGFKMGEVTLGPGKNLIQSFWSSDPSTITVSERPWEVSIVGGETVRTPGSSSTSVTPTPISPVSGTTPGTPVTVTPTAPAPGQASTDSAPGSGTGRAVWDNTAPGTGTSPALSEGVFKQGVTAITEAIRANAGSGTISMTGVETRIDTTNTRLNEIKTKQDESKALLQDVKTALNVTTGPTTIDFEDVGTGTTAMNSAAVTGVLAKLPTAPTITLPGASSGVMTLPFNLGLPGVPDRNITLDATRFDTPILLFKATVTAGLSLAGFFIVLKAIKESVA